MSVLLILWAGMVAYSTIAGLAFRLQKPPRPCAGKNRDRKYGLTCEGPFAILWDEGGSCADCQRHRRALNRAWLWPLAALLYVPRRMFWLTQDVDATPPTAKPETKITRKARTPDTGEEK